MLKKSMTADELGEDIRQQLIGIVDDGDPIRGMRRDLKLLQFKLSRPNPSKRRLILNPDALDDFIKPRLSLPEILDLLNLFNAWRLS